MQYSVEYEVCALLFLLIITARFFEIRRFPSRRSKLFRGLLVLAIFYLVLDIERAYAIEHIAALPAWLNYAVSIAFLSVQVAFYATLMRYVAALTGLSLRQNRCSHLLFLPAAFALLMLFTTPVTGLVFKVSAHEGKPAYVPGPSLGYLCFIHIFHIAAAFLFALRHRKLIPKKNFHSVICILLVLGFTTLIQNIFHEIPVMGLGIAIAALMIFLTLQNPADMVDPLSGLFNFSAMMVFLDNALREEKPLWLIAADVGGIRRVNSSFGVRRGNRVLNQIGRYFSQLQGNIIPFRMIGTRFLLVASSEEESREAIRKIRQRFDEPWRQGELDIMLSVTIRYFGEPNLIRTPEDAVNLIDVAYSEIGSYEWGGVLGIDNELLDRSKRRLRVETSIREALRTGKGFELHYQPAFNLSGQSFRTVEALLRLKDPELGAISPAEFIPVAERSGLIFQIDELVIRMACDFLRRNEKVLGDKFQYLSINLSAAEFFQDSSRYLLQRIIRESGVCPEKICFEVTETAATVHNSVLAAFMNEMIQEGYRFALDDFGTGFANITQVARLPFSIIKLDRSLLISSEVKNRIFFEDLLKMFVRMGLVTVVEGVETKEQAERVQRFGSDYVQGFYYARPMPETEYLSFLRKQAD